MSQKKTYTAADLLVKCLENEGVQYVFGLPGEVQNTIQFSSILGKCRSHDSFRKIKNN